MATDMELISDEFSDIACGLLKEYSSDIEKLRIDSIQVLDTFYKSAVSDKEGKKYLTRRFQDNVESFQSLLSTYERLVRKTSQWIQHAKEPRPGKQLELEVRLDEFEKRLQNAQRFFASNRI